MKLHSESHTDHVSPAILSYVLERFGDHQSPFKTTITLPAELGTVPCGLHGPLVGDAPVPDSEVELRPRGDRAWPSRLVQRSPRETRMLSVIAGPHGGEPCVLYTVFGGPITPREPGELEAQIAAAEKAGAPQVALDRMRDELVESKAVWALHALSA